MSDLFVDFRPAPARSTSAAVMAALERQSTCSQITVFERDAFTLVAARTDRTDLWGAFEFPGSGLLVALAGRVALTEEEWFHASTLPGHGGLACKAIAKMFEKDGPDVFRQLNGNFCVFIFDPHSNTCYLGSDRFGVCLLYGPDSSEGAPVFATHPDLAARFAEVQSSLDATSLAEFLTTGRLTFPFTHYAKIRAQDFGAIHQFECREEKPTRLQPKSFFEFRYRADAKPDEESLAQALGDAFKESGHRRSLSRLGNVAIGLSGGLDSRVILASAQGGAKVEAFSLLDQENSEWRISRAIAEARDVSIEPIKRDYDYYGRNAAEGVRLSGGMGCLMSNHYLGIRDRLRERNVGSLLTGCYCDYLFKGLALNTVEDRLTRRERLGNFRLHFYRPVTPLKPEFQEAVRERLANRFPFEDGKPLAEDEWWEVERRRVFPLAYEADLAQRVTPQRCMPWFVPIADNAILDVYQRLPSDLKLNARVFRKMVLYVCGPELCRIPDNNTGAAVNAGPISLMFHRYLSALLNRTGKLFTPGIATRGSWPNWDYYVQHSDLITDLWTKDSADTAGILTELLGFNPYERPMDFWQGSRTELFLRLLTLKLWIGQTLVHGSQTLRENQGVLAGT